MHTIRNPKNPWMFSLLALVMMAPIGCDKGGETTVPDTDAGPPEADAAGGEVDEFADDEAEEASEEAAEPAEEHLSIASFEEDIQDHLDDVGECFAAAQEKNPELKGTYQAHFTIGLDGKVKAVKAADHSEVKDDGLNACVLEKSANWQFDEPTHDDMEMNFPFAFGG